MAGAGAAPTRTPAHVDRPHAPRLACRRRRRPVALARVLAASPAAARCRSASAVRRSMRPAPRGRPRRPTEPRHPTRPSPRPDADAIAPRRRADWPGRPTVDDARLDASPSTAGATATAWDDQYGAGAGRWPARPPSRSSPRTTAGHDAGDDRARPRPCACSCSARYNARRPRRSRSYGPRRPVDDRRHRRHVPGRRRVRAWRTDEHGRRASRDTWRSGSSRPDGVTVLRSATASGMSSSGRRRGDPPRSCARSRPTYDTYRGLLRVVLNASSANVINHVALDLYLRGVVPVEMPASWPAEALRAQTVAARSYAVRRLHPAPARSTCTTTRARRSTAASRPSGRRRTRVIDAGPGVILKSGRQVVNAFFHSTGGGATENNEYAFVGSSGAVTSGAGHVPARDPRRRPGPARRTTARAALRLDDDRPSPARSCPRCSGATPHERRRPDEARPPGAACRAGCTGSRSSAPPARRPCPADVFRAVYNARRAVRHAGAAEQPVRHGAAALAARPGPG